jgi:hypothetical protein
MSEQAENPERVSVRIARGVIDYRVISRRESLYEVLRVPGQEERN